MSPFKVLFLALGCLCLNVSARSSNLLPWFFFPPEPKPAKHKFKTLDVQEIPAPAAPSHVDWFSKDNKKYHSAILVAGSKGYRNYRHQSDVCHAYRILRERGVEDDNIVTFVYDDIAYNSANPFQGQIFNSPGGKDIYPGCAKDYTGSDVNARNVLAALTGDSAYVKGTGSGRVLKADPNQRIFFFYSDHGSVGSLGMPSGSHLSAKNIRIAFDYMIKKNFFKELVFYLESCESGSIFKGFGYEKDDKILAVSASGAYESSYATYCPTFGSFDKIKYNVKTPHPANIRSCMGDLFSVSWMEYTENHDIAKMTINSQLDYVIKRTSDNDTYKLGSHVINYSPKSTEIEQQVVGNFLSFFDVPTGKTKDDAFKAADNDVEGMETIKDVDNMEGMGTIDNLEGVNSLKQRDADLLYLVDRTMMNEGKDNGDSMQELQDELEGRRSADSQIRSIVRYLISNHHLDASIGVEDYVASLLPRAHHLQVVDDWDAYDSFIEVWSNLCGELTDYSRQYTRAFVNIINAGVELVEFQEAARHICALNALT